MTTLRKLNPDKDVECWLALKVNTPQQITAMISIVDGATFRMGLPPNTEEHKFKKGAIVVLLPGDEWIYNEEDLLKK